MGIPMNTRFILKNCPGYNFIPAPAPPAAPADFHTHTPGFEGSCRKGGEKDGN